MKTEISQTDLDAVLKSLTAERDERRKTEAAKNAKKQSKKTVQAKARQHAEACGMADDDEYDDYTDKYDY